MLAHLSFFCEIHIQDEVLKQVHVLPFIKAAEPIFLQLHVYQLPYKQNMPQFVSPSFAKYFRLKIMKIHLEIRGNGFQGKESLGKMVLYFLFIKKNNLIRPSQQYLFRSLERSCHSMEIKT